MKTDEFAFFNQQLAAMLRDGIPLEGALQRLCGDMNDGALRTELQALADDLERFLNHQPILARSPSTLYRLRKFARRHRFGFVIVTGFLVLLIAATIILRWHKGERPRLAAQVTMDNAA